jgi:Tfp pilus assembly protein PilF
MTVRPHIFTFYSYKGGVGRSMALLNVAYTLHSLGRHVLIVDLDLEAPGISGFLRRNDELVPTSEDKPDVVDLLGDLNPALHWELDEQSRPELPVLENYLRSVRNDEESPPEARKYAPALNPRFRRTRLDVLCASDERDYAARLGSLELSMLSAEQLVTVGNILREIFFSHQFSWRWLDEEKDTPTRYDYILIDSRTGFTETSGLCIGPLADRLLIFCGLNDQNINGTAEFIKVVGLKPSSSGEKWDDEVPDEDTQRPKLGEKPTLLIASPVPFGEMEMKARRFTAMEKILGTKPDASISYHPRLSVFETVFCRDGTEESINREYQSITNRMLSMVRDDPTQWEMRNAPFEHKAALDLEALRRMTSLLDDDARQRTADTYAFVADRLSDNARRQKGKEADELFAAASEKYKAAVDINPLDHEVLYNWGNALLDQATPKQGTEADALFAAAGEKYQAAFSIKPDDCDVLNNWGNALSKQGEQKTGNEADALLIAAGERYQAALTIKPGMHEALNNWGNTLFEQAKRRTGEESDMLFAAAGEKYQSALILKPDKHEAFHNWGNALYAQATQKQDKESDMLFAAAGEKYQSALIHKSDKYESLANWGAALYRQATQKRGTEADTLFAAATEKFQAALAITPDNPSMINNWACALSDQAKQKKGVEADALFEAAAKKFQAALVMKPNDPDTVVNWGLMLLNRARQSSGIQADELFDAAAEKFQAALALNPNTHEALSNWGTTLLDKGKRRTKIEAEVFFAEATEKYLAALRIDPNYHSPLYNLACIEALKGDAEKTVSFLAQAIGHGRTSTQAELDEDSDFDAIRADSAFVAFRATLPTGDSDP